jgi:hypothetical protein
MMKISHIFMINNELENLKLSYFSGECNLWLFVGSPSKQDFINYFIFYLKTQNNFKITMMSFTKTLTRKLRALFTGHNYR